MLILKTNTNNIIGRLIGICILILLEYLIIHYELTNSKADEIIFGIKKIYLLYLLIILLILVIIILIISFFGVIKVEIDKTLNTIALISIFDKNIISKEDINNYYATVYYRDRKHFRGLLLQLKNNKSISLFGQNLKSINEMEEYLISRNINYHGEIKSKFPFK